MICETIKSYAPARNPIFHPSSAVPWLKYDLCFFFCSTHLKIPTSNQAAFTIQWFIFHSTQTHTQPVLDQLVHFSTTFGLIRIPLCTISTLSLQWNKLRLLWECNGALWSWKTCQRPTRKSNVWCRNDGIEKWRLREQTNEEEKIVANTNEEFIRIGISSLNIYVGTSFFCHLHWRLVVCGVCIRQPFAFRFWN